MKKIAYLLTVLALMAVMASCGDSAPKLEPFVIDSGYTILRGDTAPKGEVDATVAVHQALIEAVPGIGLGTDWVKRGEEPPAAGREILIGATNRAESQSVLATLRRDDYTVRLAGERILILGGSESATQAAAEYFLANCIGDGGTLMLPAGEEGYTHRAEYTLDVLTLQGIPIQEYTVFVNGLGTGIENSAVDFFLDTVASLSGYILDTVNLAESVKGPVIEIIMADYGDPETWEIAAADQSVSVSGNGIYSRVLGLRSISDRLKAPANGSKELHLTVESEKKNYSVAPLIQFNLPTSYPAMKVKTAEEGGVLANFLQAKAELPDEITVLSPFRPEDYPDSMRLQIFVSPDGDDKAAGTLEAPLKTPAAALDKLAGAGGGVIWLRGGEYKLDKSLELDSRHSGTDFSPVFISAYNGEKVTLTNAHTLARDQFTSIDDPDVLARVDKAAASKILVCDLTAAGLTEQQLGSFTTETRPILYLDGREAVIARYPNVGKELVMGEVVDPGKTTSGHSANYEENKDKTNGWVLKTTDKRAENWTKSDNIWMYGAVYAEWNRQHYPVTFDLDAGTVSSTEYCQYGARWQADNTIYYYNILEELDAPGEWYLDKKNGRLYVYPDEEFKAASLVTNKSPIIDAEDISNVILNGLTVSGSMGNGIQVNICCQTVIQNCTIENNGQSGLNMIKGVRSGAIYTTFTNNGSSQCRIVRSTDRSTLMPDNCFIQNCTVSGSDKNALYTGGVGMIISHNHIIDAQIFVSVSNECIFEYNEFTHGSTTTADAGMIYVGGSYLSGRGNHIRYNYFHDMAASHAAVYIDDCASGQYVYGNIVDVVTKETDSTFKGKMTYRLHNGRENVFCNNISIGATRSAFSDNANYYYESSIRWTPMRESIITDGKDVINSGIFTARYPIYADFYHRVEQHMKDIEAEGYQRNDLEEELRQPAHNVYMNNLTINAAIAFNISDAGRLTAVGLDQNYESKTSPLDENYQVKDKAVFDKLPDYVDVPFEKMGLSK